MEMNEITGAIIESACTVHTALGPGLFESAYAACLKYELTNCGFTVLSELVLPVIYDEIEIDLGYRMDLLVENTVVVELKAAAEIMPIHRTQLLTYLKLSNKPVGLLLNFNVASMRNGIVRIAN